MLIMSFKAWLNYPDYYFYWTYDGVNNSVFNAMNYVNPDMDELIDAARFEADRRSTPTRSRASSRSPSTTCRAFRWSRTSATWPCRRASRTTPTGSTWCSTSGS